MKRAVAWALLRTFRASGRLSTIAGLVLGIISSFTLAAFIEAGFFRSVLIEVGSACVLFLLLSRLLQSEPSKIHTTSLFTIGISLLIAAWITRDDYWQSILVELGAGALLFLFLELYIASFLDRIRNDEPDFFEIALLAEAVKNDDGKLAQTLKEEGIEPIVALNMSVNALAYGIPSTMEDVYQASEEFRNSSIGAPWAIEDPKWIESWETALPEDKSSTSSDDSTDKSGSE